MKANTESSLIAEYLANGGRIARIPGQKKISKGMTYNSGNHRKAPKHTPFEYKGLPKAPKPVIPTVETMMALSNTTLVTSYNLIAPHYGQSPIPQSWAKRSKQEIIDKFLHIK